MLEYTSDLGTFAAGKIIAVRDNGQVEAATSSQNVTGSTTKRLVSFPADGAVARDPSGVVAIVSQTGAASAPPSAPAPVSVPEKIDDPPPAPPDSSPFPIAIVPPPEIAPVS